MAQIIFAFATFLSTLSGGIFGIRFRNKLHLIISFTAGVLIGVSFFEIVPEFFSLASGHNWNVNQALAALVIGFLTIHILEKTALLHGAHESEYKTHHHPYLGYVGAAGLSFHSFLDGIGIGLAFHVNAHTGILVAVAVIAHDFSDGLNTVSLMLLNKNSIRKALWLLFTDALAPILGVGVTYLLVIPEKILFWYLGFFAGFLLYIGASDLLPEAHSKENSPKLILLTILGLAFIFTVSRLVR